MVSRKIEFHSNKIYDGFLTAQCNRSGQRMASYLRYSLGCIYRFQFRDRLGSPQPSPSPATSVHQENGLFFS